MKRLLTIVILSLSLNFVGKAQNLAVKTNLLYDVTGTVNLGVEYSFLDRWSADVSANYNGWTLIDDVRYKHWMIQPELRFWFCDSFYGHFLAMHGIGGQYNFGGFENDFSFLGTDFSPLSDSRFQGWAAGGGLAYGYDWILGHHLNLEVEIGAGVIYTEYDQFKCVGCGKRILSGQPYYYVGLTKAAVSLVYIF